MIDVDALQFLDGRVIVVHGIFGTVTLSLEDAETLAPKLGEAIDRARDGTPLTAATIVPQSPRFYMPRQPRPQAARVDAADLMESL